MNTFKAFFAGLVRKIRLAKKLRNDRKPTPLPIGVTAFNEWCTDILATYGFPDNDTFRWTLAFTVLGLKPTDSAMPKAYFADVLHKAAANEIAHNFVMKLKEKQENERKVEAEKKQAEATAAPKPQEATKLQIVASNDTPVQN